MLPKLLPWHELLNCPMAKSVYMALPSLGSDDRSIQMLTQHCKCVMFLEGSYSTIQTSKAEQKAQVVFEQFAPTKPTVKAKRRNWLVHEMTTEDKARVPRVYEDEKDSNLKNKISALVEQTMHDADRKMKNLEKYKEEHREEAAYRVGFILSMVKKSKDVLDELFNVAIKHRDEWLALEQLKIFELIVHTNVDTTNLLRQLVDIHVRHLNATQSDSKRVILI